MLQLFVDSDAQTRKKADTVMESALIMLAGAGLSLPPSSGDLTL